MANARHDVGVVALAMFGATTFSLGLTGALVSLPVWATAVLAIISAMIAGNLCVAVNGDVTRGEAAFGAVLAIPLAFGIQWTQPAWSTRGELGWLVGATLAGTALVALTAKRSPSPARGYRIGLVVLLTGGVGGVVFLLGLMSKFVVHNIGLTFVPWFAVVGAAALCTWRIPSITAGQVFGGQWLAVVAAFLATVPTSSWPAESAFLSPVFGAIFAGTGAGTYEFVSAWLRRRAKRTELANARVRP